MDVSHLVLTAGELEPQRTVRYVAGLQSLKLESSNFCFCWLHRKKRFTSFPSPAGMSLTKLPLGSNNSVMASLFPPRESLVVTFRLGTGNSRTFFYGVAGVPAYRTVCCWTSEPEIGIILFLFLLASWSPSVPYGMLLDFRA
jgi:hypothetical protein